MADTGNNQRKPNESTWDDRASRDKRRGPKDGRPADVSGWADRTPAGARGPIDEEEARKLSYRENQKQRVTQQDQVINKFERTQFVAHVTDRITYTRNGDMVITIHVPYQFKHLAIPLTDTFGIPLSFDVEVWHPYTEAERNL